MLFLALMIGTVAWFWEVLTTVVYLSLWSQESENFSHIVIIPFLSLFLVYVNRRDVFSDRSPGDRLGALIVALGMIGSIVPSALALEGQARWSATMLAMVVTCLGAFLLAYGRRAFRKALFGLLLLFFMVPFPPVILQAVIAFLQRASAEATAVLFELVGVSFFRDGFLFALPGLTILVAEECSGIRSTLALLIMSLVVGRLCLRSTWAKAILTLGVVPLAIIKNAVRIVVLSLLAIYVDPSFITGSLLHRYGGIPLFAVSLGILAVIVLILQKLEARRGSAQTSIRITEVRGVVSQGISGAARYVIISPVRNEQQNIGTTIRSVALQSVLPEQWILVNDGSTDRTREILEEAANLHPWISVVNRPDRGFREPGTGVIQAFYAGYEAVRFKEWQFLVKLDGDLALPEDYFERCFEGFAADPQLGIGGGTVYHIEHGAERIEHNPRFHVRGATKIYRRECWEAIGGLLRAPGWDTLDEVKAHMLGWDTRTFSEPRLLQLRATGSVDGAWRNAVKNGRGGYICGYHPLFMMLKCVTRLFERPYGITAAGLLYGYVSAYVRQVPRVEDLSLIRYLRQQQLRRLVPLFTTIWR